MQRADEYTIQKIGIPSLVLMERAALKTVEVMKEKGISLDHCLVVCGSGNNGGDGFAVARLLYLEGKDVCAVFAGKETSMSEECRQQRQIASNLGVSVVTNIPPKEYTVVIDAVFGVGLSRTIEGHYKDVIEEMNQIHAEKVAIDIPSGISSFDGQGAGNGISCGLDSFFCM